MIKRAASPISAEWPGALAPKLRAKTCMRLSASASARSAFACNMSINLAPIGQEA